MKNNTQASIDSVEQFWESNPLFSGESPHDPGTKEFFEEHRSVYYNDVFAGQFPHDRFIPSLGDGATILDLGCGAGFWTIELANRLPAKTRIVAADLTSNAIKITSKRTQIYGIENVTTEKQNAEKLTYADNSFDHVNCQGVIHHTPNTAAAVQEISRVLKPGGSAFISVYYRNILLRNWHLIHPIGRFLDRMGGKLKGRGREHIFLEKDIDAITRLYDGKENPVGKSYSRQDIVGMVSPFFEIEQIFLNFFPARALPFRVPRSIHSWLSNHHGFMIHLNMIKK